MQAKISVLLFVTMTLLFLVACSSNSTHPISQDTASTDKVSTTTETEKPTSTNTENTDTPPPADSKLAQIKKGMTDSEVRSVLGEPMSSNSYMTGKNWIPFYYGGDTRRTDYLYPELGRVVFSMNRYSGSLKVIRIIYDPNIR